MHMNEIADALFAMRLKGARLWLEGDQLRYRAAHGVMSASDILRLRKVKPDVVSFFRQTSAGFSEPPLAPRRNAEVLPLTPYQEWRYRMYHPRGMDTRATSSVRFTGTLNIDALRRAFAELVQAHEALRMIVTASNGAMQQRINEPEKEPLEVRDASGAETLEAEARELISILASEIVDLSVGPLFKAVLLRTAGSTHILVISVHSICWDGVSAAIFWRDVWKLYSSFSAGRGEPTRHAAIQPADYALWHKQTDALWRERHQSYWAEKLSGAERVRLFGNAERVVDPDGSTSTTALEFDERVTAELRALSLQERTSLGMVVLTGFIALLMRWCDKTDLVVSIHTTGRLHAAVENTIGRFQCPLFLRAQLTGEDTFMDLLQRVTDEYSAAYEHHDVGRVLTHEPAKDLAMNPNFNWIPREMIWNPTNAAFDVQPFEGQYSGLRDIEWDGEPQFVMSETDHGLTGAIAYKTKRIAPADLHRLKRNFQQFLQTLAKKPNSRVMSAPCIP
jgi:hypothetical protein